MTHHTTREQVGSLLFQTRAALLGAIGGRSHDQGGD
jgi:hypothetical protein